METIYLSEWKLHICQNRAKICGKLLWKKRQLSTISESELYIFQQRPNESYIFIHSFRMETTYFSTTSEWKLHIATIYSVRF